VEKKMGLEGVIKIAAGKEEAAKNCSRKGRKLLQHGKKKVAALQGINFGVLGYKI
jgi:hypothetical protein